MWRSSVAYLQLDVLKSTQEADGLILAQNLPTLPLHTLIVLFSNAKGIYNIVRSLFFFFKDCLPCL